MSKTSNEITANSTIGRVLIALRAGPMTSGELMERFGSLPSMSGLCRKGLVAEDDHGWRLTDAGRAACPLRNPLAGKVAKAPAGALAARSVVAHPWRTLPPKPEPILRPTKPAPTGDNPMQQLPVIPAKADKPHVDQLRRLLIESPQGIARKDLIKRTGLPDSSVDNAIVNLIKNGEAERKGYGVIAAAAGIKTPAAVIEKPVEMTSEPAVAAPTAALRPPMPEPKSVSAASEPDADTAAPEIDFSIHADGRLTIIDGNEILVLPPSATRRLGYFLGCLEINAWPPRLDSQVGQTKPIHQ